MSECISAHPAFWIAIACSLVGIGLLVRGVAFGYPAAALKGGVLSAKEQAILGVCADALLPRGGELLGGTDAGVVAYFDGMLRELPSRTRMLIRLLIHFLEHGPWIFGMSARLTRQSVERRAATLCAWSVSPIYFLRLSFMSIRTLLTMAYLADRRVAERLGAVENLSPFEAVS